MVRTMQSHCSICSRKKISTGIPLITIDVDQAADLSAAYNIQAMPTFLVIKGKWDNVIKNIVGGGKDNVNTAFDTAAQNK